MVTMDDVKPSKTKFTACLDFQIQKGNYFDDDHRLENVFSGKDFPTAGAHETIYCNFHLNLSHISLL
jgi:hypothetical protein